MGICFVGKIVFVSMFEAFHRASFVSSLVLPNADEAIDDNEKCSSNRGNEDRNEAWCINWCVCRLKEQRADEVT